MKVLVGTPVTCLKGDDEKTWGHLAKIRKIRQVCSTDLDEVLDLGTGEVKTCIEVLEVACRVETKVIQSLYAMKAFTFDSGRENEPGRQNELL